MTASNSALKPLFRKYRRRPGELVAAVSAMVPGELARGIVAKNLCAKGYAYDRANPWVPDWFLRAAQEKRDQGRAHYSIGNLLEKLRHDVAHGIVKVDEFRISNDLQSYYVRQVLMRDTSLCGFFDLKRTSDADSLVVNGRTWTDFAKEHAAELWPERIKRKPSQTVQADPPLENAG